LALRRGYCLSKAFFMGQQAIRCGSDAGLRSEAEKFVLLQRDGNSDDLSLLEDLDSSAVSVRWPPMPRVEDFQCQASQMVAMANCLEHRRVILLLGAEGAGKTATCREFAHHFGGPGRLFSGKVKFLEAQDFLDAALVGAMDKFLWKALGDLSATGEGLPLLVIDNLHIFQAAVKQELRMALEGALSSLTTLRLLLTSREGLGGDWAFLEHGKVVEVKMEDLSMEDAAQLFLRRCRRPLYPRDFEAESASLEGASVQRLLRESALLKALDRLPGCIIRAAAQVDDELSTLLNHPALGSASLKHPQ